MAYEKPGVGDGICILVGTASSPAHERCTPAHLHLDRTTVFGLWDTMSPRRSFSNKIVDAEANPTSSRRAKNTSAERNGVDDHERGQHS